MSISDERLGELIESHQNYLNGAGGAGPYLELLTALRELQQLRNSSQAMPILHQAAGVPRCYSCGDPLIEQFHRCKPGAKRQGNL